MIDVALLSLMALFARALRSGRFEEAIRALRQAGLNEEQAWQFLGDSLGQVTPKNRGQLRGPRAFG